MKSILTTLGTLMSVTHFIFASFEFQQIRRPNSMLKANMIPFSEAVKNSVDAERNQQNNNLLPKNVRESLFQAFQNNNKNEMESGLDYTEREESNIKPESELQKPIMKMINKEKLERQERQDYKDDGIKNNLAKIASDLAKPLIKIVQNKIENKTDFNIPPNYQNDTRTDQENQNLFLDKTTSKLGKPLMETMKKKIKTGGETGTPETDKITEALTFTVNLTLAELNSLHGMVKKRVRKFLDL